MVCLTWLIAGLLIVAWSPIALAAQPTARPAVDLIIQLDGEILTVKAKQVPHRQILEGLANQLNFELVVAGPLEERRSIDIEARPWEEALKRALAPASWAFVYRSSSGEPQLVKVFVFPDKAGGTSPPNPVARPTRASAPTPSSPLPQNTATSVAPAPPPGGLGTDVNLNELLQADDEETRALALIGLATMGGEQAITALTQALQDKAPWIRETAVEGLAELGGEQAMRGLEQALGDDNADVRRAAQEALNRLRQESH